MKPLSHLWMIVTKRGRFRVSRRELPGWELVAFHAGGEELAKRCAKAMEEDSLDRNHSRVRAYK